MARKIGNEWFDWASIIGRDWFQAPSLPWERIPEYMWAEVRDLAIGGVPNRAIARLIGYDVRQVRLLISKRFPEVVDSKCQCGLTRRHQGWCRIRFNQSEVRQEVIRLMHMKAKIISAKRAGLSSEEIRVRVLQRSA